MRIRIGEISINDIDCHDVRGFQELLACLCQRKKPHGAIVKLTSRGTSLTFLVTERNHFMATVADSGGPFTADISAFVDAAGNPVTDTDVPVWAVADPTIATIVVSPTNAQEATVTLTKTLGNSDVTATFPGGFVCTGNINVIAGAAVGATMVFTGPGIVPGA